MAPTHIHRHGSITHSETDTDRQKAKIIVSISRRHQGKGILVNRLIDHKCLWKDVVNLVKTN